MPTSGRASWALLFVAFLLGALVIYSPALDGSFISDDEHYVLRNVYVHDLTAENLIAILDPTSVLAVVVENYAPVHVLLHALEWEVFGPAVRGYHVVNVIVHVFFAHDVAALSERERNVLPVSYTHLTLPTTPYV